MDNLVSQLADFLADYDVDVYEDVNLGGDKYRLDCVIIEDHVGSLKARLRIKKAIDAFNYFPDSPRGVTVKQIAPIVENERSDDEYDFSVVIEFEKTDERKKQEEHFVPYDERPFTEERFEDSLKLKTEIDAIEGEMGDRKVSKKFETTVVTEIKSDVSGKKIEYDEGYRLPDGRDVTTDEAKEIYRKEFNQRATIVGDEILLTDDLMKEPYTNDDFDELFDEYAFAAKYQKLTEDTVEELAEVQRDYDYQEARYSRY